MLWIKFIYTVNMFFYFFAFLSHKKKESNSFSIKKRIRFHKHIYQIYYIYFKYYIKIYLLLLLNSYVFLRFPNISFFILFLIRIKEYLIPTPYRSAINQCNLLSIRFALSNDLIWRQFQTDLRLCRPEFPTCKAVV